MVTDKLFYVVGNSPATSYARSALVREGFLFVDHPSPEVTHLLLDAPALNSDGLLKSKKNVESVLETLPEAITIIGGKLVHPAFRDRKQLDLLKDADYLAKNALITAHCAVRIANDHLPFIMEGANVLILGWGRIGKCLGALLKSMGAAVYIYARKKEDRAMLHALGYHPLSPDQLIDQLPMFRLIFNTVPACVMNEQQCTKCRDCVKIDLASVPGICCPDAIHARGLPGKIAPESSGLLIADTILHHIKENAL